jgi:hypothetical protein
MEATDDMVIGMRTFLDEDSDQFGVEVIVSGLASQEQADRAMAYMLSLLCGAEKTVN